MTEAAFESFPDQRCQRGLAVTYLVKRAFDQQRLAQALQAAWGHQLVEATERWGTRSVVRLVRQFFFEVRLGARDGEIAFLHRAHASAEQRAHQLSVFEQCLQAEIVAAEPT